jgi:hypothetical protein
LILFNFLNCYKILNAAGVARDNGYAIAPPRQVMGAPAFGFARYQSGHGMGAGFMMYAAGIGSNVRSNVHSTRLPNIACTGQPGTPLSPGMPQTDGKPDQGWFAPCALPGKISTVTIATV